MFEFPIKPPRPDPSPHICGNKSSRWGREQRSLLPGPHRDPRRLRGRRGRQPQPQRAEPGNFRELLALARERQTRTRLSLSQQVPSSPPGADTSAAAEVSAVSGGGPRPGLSCRNFPRPSPPPPERRPQPPGGRSRGAGRGRASGGAAPRGAGQTRRCTRGARAGAATGRSGEPPTSAQGVVVAQTARAWMRRSPSRGGRGAARAGDACREGRLRSGRRMAEVSGRAGDGRGAA